MPTAAPAEVESARGLGPPGLSRPWKVIVWNDPINLMSYVTFVFQKLFGYSKEPRPPADAGRAPQGEGGGVARAEGRRRSSTCSASTSTGCGRRWSTAGEHAGATWGWPAPRRPVKRTRSRAGNSSTSPMGAGGELRPLPGQLKESLLRTDRPVASGASSRRQSWTTPPSMPNTASWSATTTSSTAGPPHSTRGGQDRRCHRPGLTSSS